MMCSLRVQPLEELALTTDSPSFASCSLRPQRCSARTPCSGAWNTHAHSSALCFILCGVLFAATTPYTGGVFSPCTRAIIQERFAGGRTGTLVPIDGLFIGPAPKHLAGKSHLLLSEQLMRLHAEIEKYFTGLVDPVAVVEVEPSTPSRRHDSAQLNVAMQNLALGEVAAPRAAGAGSNTIPAPGSSLGGASARPAALSQALRLVLCGPMGMGKSFVCWALALISYSSRRRVLYVGDATTWMDVPLCDRVRYLMNLFLSLNRDILPLDVIAALERPGAHWGHFSVILKDPHHPTLVIVDEHSAVVPEYERRVALRPGYDEHTWLLAFIHLNVWEDARNTVVLFSGSSHGIFEVRYMRNGMQEYKRFLVPMQLEEARTVLRLEAQRLKVELDAALEAQVLVVANCVPRELSHFVRFVGEPQAALAASATSTAALASALTAAAAETPSELAGVVLRFLNWRGQQMEQEAADYFKTLASDPQLRTCYLRSLTAMFARSSLPDMPGDTAGFFDLGLCYRYFGGGRQVLRPLCFAATTALLRLYHAQASAHSPLLHMLVDTPMRELKGDHFEDLMWHHLTSCCVANDGARIPCYYLNGSEATPLHFNWDDFYSLDTEQHTPPAVLRNRSILFRCPPAFPRWDFMAPNMLLQVSKSTFSQHNTKSADIRRSFDNDAAELCSLLDAMHGGTHRYSPQAAASAVGDSSSPTTGRGGSGHTRSVRTTTAAATSASAAAPAAGVSAHSVYSTSNSFRRSGHAEPVPFTLVYVTLSKPNHPRLFQEFPDVRVVAAEEVWARIRSRSSTATA